jgi:hypothetical protein
VPSHLAMWQRSLSSWSSKSGMVLSVCSCTLQSAAKLRLSCSARYGRTWYAQLSLLGNSSVLLRSSTQAQWGWQVHGHTREVVAVAQGQTSMCMRGL